MNEIPYTYFLIAVGFWLGAATVNWKSFKGQGFNSIVRGMIGCLLLWPVLFSMSILEEWKHNDQL